MEIDSILYIILGICILGRFLIMVWRTTSGHVLTGRATVVSRRVEVAKYTGRPKPGMHDQGWNYLVTFQLTDGEKIELHVFDNEYQKLKEGLAGQLTWHKDTLSSFEPDMEVTV